MRGRGNVLTQYRFGDLIPLIPMRLPCEIFKCVKIDILQYKEPATPDLVKKVTDPKGKEITKADKPILYQAIIDAIFTPSGPGAATPEKDWPKEFFYDFCAAVGCTCPKAAIVMGAPEDTTHVVQRTVTKATATKEKKYTVDIEIKVKRKLGIAACK